jgi:hypothetical protein
MNANQFVVVHNHTAIPTVWIGIRNGKKALQIDWQRLDGTDWFGAGPLKCHSYTSDVLDWRLILDGKPLGKRSYPTYQVAMRAAPHFKIIQERMSR